MREIKFRAWDKERKEWQHFTLQELITGQATIIWPKLDDWCQYTGLKDRNGKEIYEGDVIDDGQKWLVKYSGCAFMPWGGKPTGYYPDKLRYPSNFIVIGNIYENPDLVK